MIKSSQSPPFHSDEKGRGKGWEEVGVKDIKNKFKLRNKLDGVKRGNGEKESEKESV